MSFGSLRIYVYIVFTAYVLIINLIGFALMGIDKDRSRLAKWRVSEANLFIVAVLGGSIGSLAGMFYFHHKTKHPAFFIGMPLILVIQLILLLWFVFFSPFEILIL